MAKLTIQDVFAMFEPFGISAREVNETLDRCKDRSAAFNVFEGLKARATIRYEEMRSGEVSAVRFQEVKPLFERLMGIKLKNYNPKRRKTPKSPAGDKDFRNSDVYKKMAQVGGMIANKDVEGLMRMLDSDYGDPSERAAAEKIIEDFEQKMRDREGEK